MMLAYSSAERLWWLICKDLMREIRAHEVWSRAALIGMVLVLLMSLQIDFSGEQQARAASGLLWVVILFTGTLAFDRSFADEQDAGCWQSIVLSPIAASVIFLAKFIVNCIAVGVLQLLLIFLFIVLTDVPLLAQPLSLAVICVLAGTGLAAVGTLLGAITATVRNRGGLLTLLFLPLTAPVLLAAAEATRILLAGGDDPLWRWWIQLLATFSVVFTTGGALAFEFLLEE